MSHPTKTLPYSPEDLEFWKRLQSALDEYDPAWMYDNIEHTQEYKERMLEKDTAIGILSQELISRGWDAERYVNTRIKALKAEKLTHDEVRDIIENPTTGFYEGWYED